MSGVVYSLGRQGLRRRLGSTLITPRWSGLQRTSEKGRFSPFRWEHSAATTNAPDTLKENEKEKERQLQLRILRTMASILWPDNPENDPAVRVRKQRVVTSLGLM